MKHIITHIKLLTLLICFAFTCPQECWAGMYEWFYSNKTYRLNDDVTLSITLAKQVYAPGTPSAEIRATHAFVWGIESRVSEVTLPRTVEFNDMDYVVTTLGLSYDERYKTDSSIKRNPEVLTVSPVVNRLILPSKCSSIMTFGDFVGEVVLPDLESSPLPSTSNYSDYKNIKKVYCSEEMVPLYKEWFAKQITDMPVYPIGWTATTTIVNVPKAGEFAQTLLSQVNEWEDVEALVVKGELNQNDLDLMKRLANMTSLDLSETNITELPASFLNYYKNRCDKLEKVILPPAITVIPQGCFSNCRSLSNVVMPGVKHICSRAFAYTIMDELTTLENVETIESSAFQDCAIKQLDLPQISSMGESAFTGNKNLYRITWGQKLHEIPSGAFSSCQELQEIDLSNITSIGASAFSDAEKLKDVVFCNQLQSIGSGAFSGCTSFEHIVLPASLQSCGSSAFGLCTGVKDVTSKAVVPPVLSGELIWNVDLTHIPLYVPEKSRDLYRAAKYWQDFMVIYGADFGDDVEPQVCATPQITIVDGQLAIVCETEGAVCHTTVTCDDNQAHTTKSGERIALTGQYVIRTYATADGVKDSEVAEAVLIWVSPVIEGDGVLVMGTKKAVVICSVGNQLKVCGTKRGEKISLYTVGGVLLSSLSASDGETVIPCVLQQGETYIVKYGDRSIKCRL